jgi:hypothetical protein
VKLQPEEVAPMLLQYLNGFNSRINRYNIFLPSGELGSYAASKLDQVADAMEEAWMVLEREGLVAHSPGDSYGLMYFVTRRGRSIRSKEDFRTYAMRIFFQIPFWILFWPKK